MWEDICNHCFVLINATKYNFAAAHLEKLLLGSMTDLLCVECNEDEEDFPDDNNGDFCIWKVSMAALLAWVLLGGKIQWLW